MSSLPSSILCVKLSVKSPFVSTTFPTMIDGLYLKCRADGSDKDLPSFPSFFLPDSYEEDSLQGAGRKLVIAMLLRVVA